MSMPISAAETGPYQGRPRLARDIAIARTAAAVLWAIIYLLALGGRRVLAGSGMPVLPGLLLAAYPAIDAVASISEYRLGPGRARLRTAVVIDVLAIAGLLIATLGLYTQSVLTVFGAWALAAGILQLTQAWRGGRSRRSQLPLIISGAISAIAGISFAALATQPVAPLPDLAGYAFLGAVFFLAWTLANRENPQPS